MFLKEWYRKRALRKISTGRDAKFISYTDIRTIAFIFNLSEENILSAIKKFLKTSEDNNIKVYGMAINDTKQVPNLIMDSRISILNMKDVDFYGIPRASATEDFVSKKYDLLIDFSSKYCFLNEYLSTSVNAHLKVGKINYEGSPHDFILQPETLSDNDSFMGALHHYLSSIDFS